MDLFRCCFDAVCWFFGFVALDLTFVLFSVGHFAFGGWLWVFVVVICCVRWLLLYCGGLIACVVVVVFGLRFVCGGDWLRVWVEFGVVLLVACSVIIAVVLWFWGD